MDRGVAPRQPAVLTPGSEEPGLESVAGGFARDPRRLLPGQGSSPACTRRVGEGPPSPPQQGHQLYVKILNLNLQHQQPQCPA